MSEEVFEMTTMVLGGLGIFLLGMRNMSDGLQTIAGSGLRRLIGMVTDNRLMAVVVGTAVTCLVQSSSITTVMVVGFVNSGIMALHQAMGVVLGANIGTTITGWILVLKVGVYGLPILGLASFFVLFSKREKVKYAAMAVMGIGMVFFGLELMKDGFKPIRKMPEFEAWFHAFQADTYLGVLKCAFVGCVLTLIVQSSSATLGITIALANTGVLSFETAAALVMGENVGTTITAILASIGASANARRAAYFHTLFNVTGVLWITAIFGLYLPFIRELLLYTSGVEDLNAAVTAADGSISYPHTTIGIATVHSVFNIANVIVFLPFIRKIAPILEALVKERRKREKRYLTNLEFHVYDSPIAAIEQSAFELDKMKKSTRGMLDLLRTYLADPVSHEAIRDEIFKREDILDSVQKEITIFLSEGLSGQMSHELTEESKDQLRLSDEYESVSDYITQILKLELRIREAGFDFTQDQKDELAGLHSRTAEYFDYVIKKVPEGAFEEYLAGALELGEDVNNEVRRLRSLHWDRLSHEQIAPILSTTYADTLQSYRKIKEHLLNVAEVRSGVK